MTDNKHYNTGTGTRATELSDHLRAHLRVQAKRLIDTGQDLREVYSMGHGVLGLGDDLEHGIPWELLSPERFPTFMKPQAIDSALDELLLSPALPDQCLRKLYLQGGLTR